MGGKKKLTLKQMERASVKKDEQKGRKSSGGSSAEKKSAGIVLPDPKSEKTVGELKKIKALTPYAVASRFDLRLSLARDLLEELERRGVIEYVSGSRNIKIYKPAD